MVRLSSCGVKRDSFEPPHTTPQFQRVAVCYSAGTNKQATMPMEPYRPPTSELETDERRPMQPHWPLAGRIVVLVYGVATGLAFSWAFSLIHTLGPIWFMAFALWPNRWLAKRNALQILGLVCIGHLIAYTLDGPASPTVLAVRLVVMLAVIGNMLEASKSPDTRISLHGL